MKFWPPLASWLFALGCLTGCAGGGGSQNTPASYPTLNSLSQPTALTVASSNITFNNPIKQFSPTGGTVAISVAGNGSAITTVNVSVTGVGGVTFQQSFVEPFLAQKDASNNTVLFSSSVTALDGSVRQLLFANSSYALFNLSYTTLGFWEYDASLAAPSGVGGAFAAGIATRPGDLPTTGSANYTGGMLGRYADGTTSGSVSANATSTASFAAGTVSLTTSSTFKTPLGGTTVSDNSLNLSGVLLFPVGTNQITGTLTSVSGMTGPASAKFFGPSAQELGGTFFISNGGNTQQMNGAFGLHR